MLRIRVYDGSVVHLDVAAGPLTLRLAEAYLFTPWFAATPATSSSTPSAESPGAGSAPAITGLIRAQADYLARIIESRAREHEDYGTCDMRLEPAVIALLSALDAELCATGGSATPPPHSGAPHRPARGESSALTSQSVVSAIMGTSTPPDWSGLLRMAAELRAGVSAVWSADPESATLGLLQHLAGLEQLMRSCSPT